jgi:hypothetical protein
MTAPEEDFALCVRLGGSLPGVSLGQSYGTPALRTKRRAFLRLNEAGQIVLMLALEDKEMLLASRPDAFYETDHYRGWPAVLVRPSALDEGDLAHWIARAWEGAAGARESRALREAAS